MQLCSPDLCYFNEAFSIIKGGITSIDPLHDPVTWYGINCAGTQVTQWDFQTKELVPVQPDWKFHCVTCVPAWLIPYHVTESCKGPIGSFSIKNVDVSRRPNQFIIQKLYRREQVPDSAPVLSPAGSSHQSCFAIQGPKIGELCAKTTWRIWAEI